MGFFTFLVSTLHTRIYFVINPFTLRAMLSERREIEVSSKYFIELRREIIINYNNKKFNNYFETDNGVK